MNISKILVRAYCVLEFIAALLVAALVIGMRVADPIHDRAEYLDYWEMGLIGLAWMFFISLPVILIYLISLVRAIPLRTLRQKAMLAIHVLNVALWVAFYLVLPRTEPCTAAEMERHYISHQDQIHDLIAYTKSCLNDSTALHYEIKHGGDTALSADNFGGQWNFYLDDKDSVLLITGITHAQFDTITAMMKEAGVTGLNINRGGYNRKSSLVYRYYGATSYEYVINHDLSQQVDTTGGPLGDLQDIAYNDSIHFQSLGGLVWHGFPDHNQYNKRRQRVVNAR